MKLKIGPVYYRVKNVPTEDIGRDYADTQQDVLLIRVSETVKPEIYPQTLLHEVLHAINLQMDHFQVESLAQSLTQVLKDNPHFTKLFL